jgi:hypothetical protein
MRGRRSLVFMMFVTGCASPSEKASKDIIQFAGDAPFRLARAGSAFSGYSVVVKDSSIVRYNAIFEWFDPKDSSRSSVYADLPGEILANLPLARALSSTNEKVSSDTSRTVVVFSRPDLTLFVKALDEALARGDTTEPTAVAQERFTQTLQRARAGLQTIDTAIVDVANGSVRIRTKSRMRASVELESRRASASKALRSLAEEIAFERPIESNDYTSRSYSLDPLRTTSTVNGSVSPGPAGWYVDDKISVIQHVQCAGVRGSDTTFTSGYISIDEKIGTHSSVDFLCMWYLESGDRWKRVRPESLFVRYTAVVSPKDTIRGKWTTVGAVPR